MNLYFHLHRGGGASKLIRSSFPLPKVANRSSLEPPACVKRGLRSPSVR